MAEPVLIYGDDERIEPGSPLQSPAAVSNNHASGVSNNNVSSFEIDIQDDLSNMQSQNPSLVSPINQNFVADGQLP